jgi:hypothetical protein
VDDRVIVVEPVPESEPVFDELAPVVTDAVGERDTDRERLIVELGVIDDVAVLELVGVLVGVPLPVALGDTLELSEILGVILALAPNVTEGVAEFDNDALRVDVDDGVREEVAVPDPVEVAELVGVDVRVIVVEPVPVSEPVFDELAPTVTEAVGVRDTDRERLVVELGVIDDVAVFELVGVPVVVPLPDSLAELLGVSEILGVALALAPNVTEGVAEFDSDALREEVDEGVDDAVPVDDEVPEPELVCVDVGGGVAVAVVKSDDVEDDVTQEVGVPLADPPADSVVVGVEVIVVVDDPLSLLVGV